MRIQYPGGSGYLKSACDYVHLNPVRAKLLRREERLLGYPSSSLGGYLAAPELRPGWIRVDRLLGDHGIPEDTPAGRQEFERQMLDWVEGKLGENHSGELRLESAETRAERIISEELRQRGWNEADLANRRKSDPEKLAMASRLRKETTLTIKRIAARRHLGASRSANAHLHTWRRANALRGISQPA